MRYNRSCCNYGSISYRNTPAQDGIRADPNVISYSYFATYQTRGGGQSMPVPEVVDSAGQGEGGAQSFKRMLGGRNPDPRRD